jgi:hypothetical protein
MLARGLGFEPKLHAPEAWVLPLDDPRIIYFVSPGTFSQGSILPFLIVNKG